MFLFRFPLRLGEGQGEVNNVAIEQLIFMLYALCPLLYAITSS
jgi:hypothetical protein